MKNSIILLLQLFFFSSCYYDNVSEMHPEVGLIPDCDEDTTLVTYDKDIKPLLINNCGSNQNGCHGTNSIYNIPLDTYDNVVAFTSTGELLGSILHDPSAGAPMPYPDGKLSECKINKVRAWINQGLIQ